MAKILINSGDQYNTYVKHIFDNIPYVIHFYYNSRNNGWYIAFYDFQTFDETLEDNGEALIYGLRRLMPNQDVLSRVADTRLPQGRLYCADGDVTATENTPPVGIESFGTGRRYNLIYFTELEVITYL